MDIFFHLQLWRLKRLFPLPSCHHPHARNHHPTCLCGPVIHRTTPKIHFQAKSAWLGHMLAHQLGCREEPPILGEKVRGSCGWHLKKTFIYSLTSVSSIFELIWDHSQNWYLTQTDKAHRICVEIFMYLSMYLESNTKYIKKQNVKLAQRLGVEQVRKAVWWSLISYCKYIHSFCILSIQHPNYLSWICSHNSSYFHFSLETEIRSKNW